MNRKNILVIGYNDHNLEGLHNVEKDEQYNFIPVFRQDEIQKAEPEDLDMQALLNEARTLIEKQVSKVDAIISFFDFPFTLISFLLGEEYGLRAPSLAQGLKCEHKYWSRMEQRKVIPEHVPEFAAVNPYEPTPLARLEVPTPFWLKPVKGFSSQLGFEIKNEELYEESLQEIREEIMRLAKPFNYFLGKADLPEEIASVDGKFCLAEASISGRQCTVSGYAYEHEIYTYGLIDSLHYEGTQSFLCYAIPSDLPVAVQERMREISKKVMKQISFNNSTFNIEFFYNEEDDSIKLLEINPRMSQSHADMYAKVKGYSNHQVLIKLALGEKPHFKEKQGKYEYAAKFQYRVFEDGAVQHVPDEDKIREIEEKYDDTLINIDAKEGQKLSELTLQDSYSYALGNIMIGAHSREALFEKYEKIIQDLDIKIRHA